MGKGSASQAPTGYPNNVAGRIRLRDLCRRGIQYARPRRSRVLRLKKGHEMECLLRGHLGFLLSLLFWVSCASDAIAGPWGRGFPPINSWPCPPFFGWSQGWFSMLLTVLFWAAVIGLCALVIKRLFFSGKESPLSATRPLGPLDLLKQRYARGEISRAEYRALQKDLRS